MDREDIRRRTILESADNRTVRETDDGGSTDAGVGTSRRGFLQGVTAGALSLGGLGLGSTTAAAAGRTQLDVAEDGDYSGAEGVDMGIYKAQTDRDAAVELFFQKAQHILGQLVDEEIIPGWRVTLFDTDRESVDNNKGENWGAYDVGRIYEDEGWTERDIALWFTGEAKIWNKDTSSYEWQSVGGGSAGYQTAFDPDSKSKIAPCWMSTKNTDRVVAHGASMEMMHAMVDGSLGPVQRCHGGHGEHSLGNAVYEYNEDYGETGFYGSPIAAGPSTWTRGACAAGVTEKNGITFTLSNCTKKAVEYTKHDRVPGLSMGSLDGTGRPDYLKNSHVLTIEGTQSGFTNYTLKVGDTLQKSTANGASINDHDDVTTTSGNMEKVEGKTWTGTDSYEFRGRIAQFTCENFDAIEVTLDGERVYPDSLDADAVVVEGAVSAGWDKYEIRATGEMEKAEVDGATIASHDYLGDTTAEGWTYGGKDAYRFHGGIEVENSDLSEVDFYFL